ncbi:MAG: tetratricopeptide repeat protein [Bacteroides sp.]|nr:tetratricopeptide repeat protein [Bacteroides sp.]MCM1379795.1 tetratricopeptide repeat protein [Bacteroides sp.]MCM1446154.1 tetratricopeptide repeat protein [Prevotella sp.]
MKKLFIITLIILQAAAVNAGLVAEADSAYMSDDFKTAAVLYQEAIDSLGPSAERYYNLGNAYYRCDLPGMAIVSYERALRLDPTNKDIRENLEFVNSKIVDRLNPSTSLVGGVADTVAAKIHPNAWAWVGIVSFLLALGGASVWFFCGNIALRKVGFFGAIILVIVCVIANILAYRAASKASDEDSAVVISPSVILSTTPRVPKDRSEEAMLLHEGTKVTILDSLNTSGTTWYDVQVDDSHRAWISSESLEII